MNVRETLLGRERFGVKLGLQNIAALVDALDHPERAYPTLIVAGTNGKGSATAMTATALSAAGHRTARYTSPHLTRLEERFVVDGVPATPAAVDEAAGQVLDAEGTLIATGGLPGPATFFELTTACAFVLFREARVDIAVLEVGLGGRFDATNVATPMAGAITTIDLDHTEQLGDAVEAIAFEKAGVIKPGMPVVTGERKPAALDVIRRVCRERAAPLIEALDAMRWSVSVHPDGSTWLIVSSARHDYGCVRLALTGRHQAVNALVAVGLLEAVDGLGIAVPPAAIVTGLERTRWPARLQWMRYGAHARVLVDAAHNAAGAAALAGYLGDVGARPMPFVIGSMRDKDAGAMLRALAPHASEFVVTQASTARAMPAVELLAAAAREAPDVPAHAIADPAAALAHAVDRSGTVCLTGSILLAGEIAPLLAPEA